MDASDRSMAGQLAALDPRALWATFTRQSWGFWLLCFYFFLEYVRPQSIYPAIDVLPWAQLALVGCALAALLEGKVRLSVPLAGLLGAFALIITLSVFFAYEPSAFFARPELFANWLIVFFLTVSLVDREERVFLFILLYLLWNLKMSQHGARSWTMAGFRFRDWGATGAPGWFHNSGEFGIQMTMFFPLSVYFVSHCWERCGAFKRLFLLALPVTGVMSIVASSSRGAYLGLAAGILVLLLQFRRLKTAALLGALCIGAVLMVPSQQWERFEGAGEDNSSQARLTYWKHGIEIMNRYPLLGVGYENWLDYYRDNYSRFDRFGAGQEPHNIFIEAGAELGYSGLIVFVFLILGTLWVNRRTRLLCGRLGPDGGFYKRMAYGLDAALAGFLVSGFFVTVLYYPFFWVNLSMTVALHLAARRRLRPPQRAVRPGVAVPPARAARKKTASRGR